MNDLETPFVHHNRVTLVPGNAFVAFECVPCVFI